VAAGHSRSYDVTGDGRRFLFLKVQMPPTNPIARELTASSNANLVVVINWIEELRARMRQN
jgi:hypothetical protein